MSSHLQAKPVVPSKQVPCTQGSDAQCETSTMYKLQRCVICECIIALVYTLLSEQSIVCALDELLVYVMPLNLVYINSF